MPSLNNISWERVEKEDSVTYPCDDKNLPGNEIVFSQNFPTSSGLAKIVPTDLISPLNYQIKISICLNYWKTFRTLAYRCYDKKVKYTR